MSERATPETDKARLSAEERRRFASGKGVLYEMVSADFARRLERERDEAKDILRELVRLKAMHDEIKFIHDAGTHLHKQKSEEYRRCKPIAWDRARAFVEAKP